MSHRVLPFVFAIFEIPNLRAMRSFLITLLLFAISSFAFSQKATTIYLDKHGFPVEEAAEAASYLSISDTTTGHHLVKEFDINGTLESKGDLRPTH